jgi:hypothetical protein
VPEAESAWLFKIAENVCLSRRRSSWRRGRIESPSDFDVIEEVVPGPSRQRDELIGIEDALASMPEQQRRAILLREWQGLSYREIGEELELSQAAVETLIFRARRSLAAGLEQPPETKKRKLVRGADLGNVLAGVKSLFVGGGAAVKVAATVAVVSAGTVVAAAPVQQHRAHSHRAPAPATAPAASTAHVAPGSSSSVAGPAMSFPALGAERGAKAPGHAISGSLATLGSVPGGTLSAPEEGAVAVPPAEQAPVAAPPASAAPAEATPQPAAEVPHQATPPPPAANDKSTNDKSRSDGDSTPAAKDGPSSTEPLAVTPPVQPVTPSSKGSDSKGSDSKGSDSKGSDSKGSDSKGSDDKGSDSKKPSAAAVTPPVTLALAVVVPADPLAASPAATPSATPTQASEGKPKDSGKGTDK